MLIIFDTNAVNLLPPAGPRADIIRKLRQSGHHKVAVPWMVLEELVAHKAKVYLARHQSATRALDALRSELVWELEGSLEGLDLERCQEHWRGTYGEIFEMIDTSGAAARKALAREAMALPPTKQGEKRAEGGRDASIWFSILEYMEANPEEHVYFVTNNHRDFGDGAVYPYPMNEDLHGMESRLTRLKDFNEVVSTFTREVSGQDAEAAAEELLKSLSVRDRVAQTAVEVLISPSGFLGLGSVSASVRWSSWLASPEVELLSIADVTGHEIEGDVWYTANTQWLLFGAADHGPHGGVQDVACVWEMKVLFSANGGDEAPTLLTPGEPSLPDMADERCVGILQRLKGKAVHTTRRAIENMLHPRSSYLAEQIAASLPKLDIPALIQPGFAEQIAASLPKLDIASTLQPGFAEQIAASLPKLDIPALIQPGFAEQIAASLPKLDIAALLPHNNIAEQIAASLPKYDFSGLISTTEDALDQAALASPDDEPDSDDDTDEDDADDER